MECNKREHSMFVEINNSVAFKCLIDSMKIILDECYFKFTKDGIEIRSSNILIYNEVHCKLLASSFSQYHVDKDIRIGLVLSTLVKCLKEIKQDEILYLYMENDNVQHLHMIVFESKNIINRVKINTMDVNENEIVDDNNDYIYKIRMPSKKFQGVCKKISNIGGSIVKIGCLQRTISFQSHNETITSDFYMKGVDGDEDPNGDNNIVFIQDNSVPHEGKFSTKNLYSLSNCANKLSQYVTVFLENDKPLMLEYSCPDLGIIRFKLDTDNRKLFI